MNLPEDRTNLPPSTSTNPGEPPQPVSGWWQKLVHAFSIPAPLPLTASDEKLFARIATEAVRRGLAVPAVLLLETSAPVAYLAGQTLRVLAPTLEPMFSTAEWTRFATILERPDGCRQLSDRIAQHSSGTGSANSLLGSADPVSSAAAVERSRHVTHSPPFSGLVLCGGNSQRMGQPKHRLTLHGEPFVAHVCRALAAHCQPVAVVARRNIDTGSLPDEIIRLNDADDDSQGPLAGIAAGIAGLYQLAPGAPAVVVATCDSPLLRPAVVQELTNRYRRAVASPPAHNLCLGLAISNLAGFAGFPVVLNAQAANVAQRLLESGERSLQALLRQGVQTIPAAELLSVDPAGDSFLNVNSPADFAALLQRTAAT